MLMSPPMNDWVLSSQVIKKMISYPRPKNSNESILLIRHYPEKHSQSQSQSKCSAAKSEKNWFISICHLLCISEIYQQYLDSHVSLNPSPKEYHREICCNLQE